MPPAATSRPFALSDFDFHLPPELIAQTPAPERSASRLLDGRHSALIDRSFKDLPGLLQPGDLLVFNDTQVVPARLFGEKPSGGQLELLVERVLPDTDDAAHQVVAHAVYELARTNYEVTQEIAQAKLDLERAKLAVITALVAPPGNLPGGLGRPAAPQSQGADRHPAGPQMSNVQARRGSSTAMW